MVPLSGKVFSIKPGALLFFNLFSAFLSSSLVGMHSRLKAMGFCLISSTVDKVCCCWIAEYLWKWVLGILAFSDFFVATPFICKVFWVVVSMVRVKAFYYLKI